MKRLLKLLLTIHNIIYADMKAPLGPCYTYRFFERKRKFGLWSKEVIQAGERILDVGSGPGIWSCESARCGAFVVGFDVDPNIVKMSKAVRKWYGLKHSVDFLVCDASSNFPFRDSVFDRVQCIAVLEHLKDDLKAMLEIKRVLKDGGNVTIVVPNAWRIDKVIKRRGRKWKGASHIREYTISEIMKLIHNAGLKLSKIIPIGFGLPVLMNLMNLSDMFIPLGQLLRPFARILPGYAHNFEVWLKNNVR